MLRTAKSKFDIGEVVRKLKRVTDGGVMTYRRIFCLLLSVCVFFYILPPIIRYVFRRGTPVIKDPLLQCMDDRLTPFYYLQNEYDASILHSPPLDEEKSFVPYVGNGYIGLEVAYTAQMYIKSGRSLQLATPFEPLVSVAATNGAGHEASVVEYVRGITHRFQCYGDYFVSYAYYAHRTHPSILMQEIKITNTRNSPLELELVQPRVHFQPTKTRIAQLGPFTPSGAMSLSDFDVITGPLPPAAANTPPNAEPVKQVILSVVKPQLPRTVQLKKRGSLRLLYPIAVHYTRPVLATQLQDAMADTETKAIQAMTKALQKLQAPSDAALGRNAYKQEHIRVWADLWATGFSISTSKAESSLNGDRINATTYAVLSHVRSYEYEEIVSVSAPSRQEITKTLTYTDGCYDSYHTLQADNLWRDIDTLANLNNLVYSWLLTLEKQGCHHLVHAGASGVIQAMVLSFGSFRFSNQHLECNMHPKFLHRDFLFRRLNYGNRTHVNVSISVTEDNKAIINVALDRSDRSYYACDGGCLDEPVLLTQSAHQFPVKLTEPLTAILYITEDKQHMEELHKAIHVKEVGEAPAHEQHVIALHKHGHQLGGLPTLFWVSVCAIIIVFHVFLCKLIVKEYCDPPEKMRYRYNKP